MKHSIIFYFFVTQLSIASCKAQSDILILKKNLKTVRTFFPGSEINVSTTEGYYYGNVTSINRDSIFLIQYDIRQIPSNLGVYFLDTVASYRFACFIMLHRFLNAFKIKTVVIWKQLVLTGKNGKLDAGIHPVHIYITAVQAIAT